MSRHRVGPGTVQRAVAALAARGLLEARPGRGTFVAPRGEPSDPSGPGDLAWQTVALGPRIAEPDAVEDFLRLLNPVPLEAHVLSTGYLPSELQPHRALAQALGRAARRPGAWDRRPLAGIGPLRAWFAAQAGGAAEPGDVLICPGGQAALTACFRALAAPGEQLLVESPTYLGALLSARAAGLEPVPVPSDRHGVRADLLAGALVATGARLVYLQPAFANPHGATLAAERRTEVLDAIGDAGAFLIEDDAFRDLAFDGDAPASLAHADPDGHVVVIRSLTKPTSPGFRIAGLLARGPAAARLRTTRAIDDLFVAGPLQEAAVELVSGPAWPRHLRTLRRALRARRDACAAAIDERFGPGHVTQLPAGGMHLWIALDPGEDDVELARRAARAGIVVSAGRPYFPAEAPAPHLRVTFAAAAPARLAESVRALAGVRIATVSLPDG